MPLLSIDPSSPASQAGMIPPVFTRPRTLSLLVEVNFIAYFFSLDKMAINMKMLMLFLGKCVRTAAKTMVVDRKNQKALTLLYLASGSLRNAARELKRCAARVRSRLIGPPNHQKDN